MAAIRNIVIFLLFLDFSGLAQVNYSLPDSALITRDSSQLKNKITALRPSIALPAMPKTDSSYTDTKEKLTGKSRNALKDSSLHSRQLPHFLSKPTGTISAGYEYGIIPFAANFRVPLGYYKTEGNGSIQLAKLPFNVSFFYSTLKNISGLNNYFRISFDAQKYKEGMIREQQEKLLAGKARLSELEKQKQQMDQRMYYLKNVAANPDYSSYLNTVLGTYKNKLAQLQAPALDTGMIPSTGSITDSLTSSYTTSLNGINPGLLNTDSLKGAYTDSINRLQGMIRYCDSAQYYIGETQGKINALNGQIAEAKRTTEALQNASPFEVSKQYLPSKYANILGGVKKFEIGMCYPSNSTFLVNGVALKGIHSEWEKKQVYFSFTAGKTVNNLLYSNNAVLNSMQNVRNLYNYFDFNNVIKGRNIIAVKTGYGTLEGTHVLVGMMHGLGYSSYITDSTMMDAKGNDKERNLAFEFDSRYKLKNFLTLDLVYGKSSLFNLNENLTPQEERAQRLFNFNYRSNAISGKSTVRIEKTKSLFTAGVRVVDPYFTSFGVYFIRKDNLRYEFKLEQNFTSKIKLSLSYRKDQNNLLHLFNYYNTIQTIGSGLTYKINRQLTVRAIYNPILQKVTDNESYLQITKNNISNFILTFSPRSKNITSSLNAIYSYYHLTLPTTTNIFKNASLNYSLQAKNSFRNNFSVSWFSTNNTDTLGNNTFLIAEDCGFQLAKKINIGLGSKLSLNSTLQPQLGYSLKVNAPVCRLINFEISAERLVLGDFYNSFNYADISRFPYYGYTKLICNF